MHHESSVRNYIVCMLAAGDKITGMIVGLCHLCVCVCRMDSKYPPTDLSMKTNGFGALSQQSMCDCDSRQSHERQTHEVQNDAIVAQARTMDATDDRRITFRCSYHLQLVVRGEWCVACGTTSYWHRIDFNQFFSPHISCVSSSAPAPIDFLLGHRPDLRSDWGEY